MDAYVFIPQRTALMASRLIPVVFPTWTVSPTLLDFFRL